MKLLREILIAASLISLAGCKDPAAIDERDIDKQRMINVLLEINRPQKTTEEGYLIGPCFDYQGPEKNYQNSKEPYFNHEEPARIEKRNNKE